MKAIVPVKDNSTRISNKNFKAFYIEELKEIITHE
jgi:CMP-N-acetylneuraminic acid synthetase